jgi:hypothetical protein
MKALDIVRTPKGGIAVVIETLRDGKQGHINFIKGCDFGEHLAWWDESELTVIDSIPFILASAMKHPFGCGQDDVDKFFGEK